jgi:hypothetical protein
MMLALETPDVSNHLTNLLLSTVKESLKLNEAKDIPSITNIQDKKLLDKIKCRKKNDLKVMHYCIVTKK